MYEFAHATSYPAEVMTALSENAAYTDEFEMGGVVYKSMKVSLSSANVAVYDDALEQAQVIADIEASDHPSQGGG